MQNSITETVDVRSGTIPVHEAAAYTESKAMQVGFGETVSKTVSWKLQLALFPDGSVAWMVIVVVALTVVPAAGDCTNETVPQASLAVVEAV